MAGTPGAARRRALVSEARLQTEAIGRLEAWLRLAYSLLAVGVLLAWWGSQGGPAWALPAGVVAAVAFGAASAVLRLGVTRAKANVGRILEAAEGEPAPPAGDDAPAEG